MFAHSPVLVELPCGVPALGVVGDDADGEGRVLRAHVRAHRELQHAVQDGHVRRRPHRTRDAVLKGCSVLSWDVTLDLNLLMIGIHLLVLN